MQFYAFDEKKSLIHAQHAKKNLNYQCIECQTRVRLRGGLHRQLHFFHLDPSRSCHLYQKGMAHLQLQNFLFQTLPLNDCQLEYRFPTINRIADVVWFSKKIVFEIQCSPITTIEIQQRNRDYLSQGWRIIWILHDQRYNQKFLTPAEKALENHPHYFSNMNSKGEGLIYDQFEIIDKGIRINKMSKLPIQMTQIFPISQSPLPLLATCKKRIQSWNYFFDGDLISNSNPLYCQMALDFEKKHQQEKSKRKIKQMIMSFVNQLIIHPYRVLFRYLLEKACR